jgi:hypothetical protein
VYSERRDDAATSAARWLCAARGGPVGLHAPAWLSAALQTFFDAVARSGMLSAAETGTLSSSTIGAPPGFPSGATARNRNF